MVMQERVRERTEERSGREELVAMATQEIGASDSEAIRQTIPAKIDAGESIYAYSDTFSIREYDQSVQSVASIGQAAPLFVTRVLHVHGNVEAHI